MPFHIRRRFGAGQRMDDRFQICPQPAGVRDFRRPHTPHAELRWNVPSVFQRQGVLRGKVDGFVYPEPLPKRPLRRATEVAHQPLQDLGGAPEIARHAVCHVAAQQRLPSFARRHCHP